MIRKIGIAACCGVFFLAVSPAAYAMQSCYSARNCTGKVLSHRDQHNCKIKSRGKSWRSNSGQCVNL